MLGKLLKYEFKYLVRDLARTYIIYGAVLLSVILLFQLAGAGNSDGFILSLFSACATAYVIFTIVLVILTIARNVRRFKRNMFSQEGYLTNTLPVTPEQHIVAKAIAGAVSCAVSYLVIFVGLWILFVGLGMGREISSVFSSLVNYIKLSYFIPAFLSTTTGFLAVLLCLYLAVSISSMIGGSKGKAALLVIGAYIAYTMIASLITTSIADPNIYSYIDSYTDYADAVYRTTALRMYILTMLHTGIAAAEFFAIVHIIKNKLNLQ